MRAILALVVASAKIAAAEDELDGGVPDATVDAFHMPDGGAPGDGGAPTITPVPERDDSVTLTEVHIDGELLESEQRLATFLELAPGSKYGTKQAIALPESLDHLGYGLKGPPRLDGTKLTLHLFPLKVVRSIRVRGNFPLFDDEILRHVSFTSGSPLPPDELVDATLAEEAQRISDYLGREGYFGNSVRIEQRQRPKQHAVDLLVRVKLGGWARPYKVEAVKATGNHAISDHDLLDLFTHGWAIWGRFSLSRMRDDARKAEQVLKDRGYPAARVIPDFDVKRDADPVRRRITLPIRVSEKRRVELHFVGNRELSDHDLRRQLTIFSTGAYDEIELEASARAVERYYQQHGYFEARVTFRRRRTLETQPGKRTEDVEDITFLVDEGPELRVRQVEVVGEDKALTFESDDLLTKAAIETKPFPRLGAIGLGSGGYVTALQLAQDEERIVTFYKGEGFPHAKAHGEIERDPAAFGALGALGAASASTTPQQTDLYVRFYVDEGPREMCGSIAIEFVGDHVKSEPEIARLVKTAPGTVYTPDRLAEDLRRIASAYKSLARPYVQVDYSASSWNADHTRIALRFKITEGVAVRFGEIVIRGNFRTHDRVILKDLPFHPGDPFDLTKLEEGERNLQTHFIFDSVNITSVGLSSQHTTVPILVTVRERYLDYGGFVFSLGVSSDQLPRYGYISAAYLWSNFFGFGSQLELRGDYGLSNDSWGVLGRYSDPRVFGPKWRFDMTGFYRREVTDRLGPITVYGASLALTRFLTSTLRTYVRYDNYLSQTAVGFSRLPGTNDHQSVGDNTHTSKFNVGLLWDRRVDADGRPSPLAPYKGWMMQGQVGWAFPSSVPGNAFVDFFSSDHNFLLFAAQILVVQPLRIRTTGFQLLVNLRYDEGIPFDSPALPAVERYFAGGDTATRGYEPDELKTEIVRTGVAPLTGQSGFRVIPQGGNVRLLSTIELQFPIARTFFGVPFPWVGAVFYDAGAVFDGWNVLSTSDVKHSIGFSFLRLQTPIGIISLDYGYPLVQTLAEERWKSNPWYSHFPGRIHFNVGIPLARF